MENEIELICERCGENHVMSQMKPFYIPYSDSDFDVVYYCQACFNRIMENIEQGG